MDNIELELQLRVAQKNKFEDMLKNPYFHGEGAASPKTEEYETTYFDTADHRLQNKKYSFRIRKSASGLTATVKEDGPGSFGVFSRGEWNKNMAQDHPAVDIFSDLPVGRVLEDMIGQESLFPQFKTHYKRTSAHVTVADGSVVELAANIGEISSGDQTEEICELELELLSGNASALYALAGELSALYPLLPEEKNKYARGLALAGLVQPSEGQTCSPAESVRLEKHYKKQELSDILSGQLGEIIKRQCAFLRSPESPEAAHQLRAHVRRLRSVLYMMKPLLHPEEYAKVQTALRDYALLFAQLRDFDVLIKKWQRFSGARPELAVSPSGFLRWIKARRKSEQKAVLTKIETGRSTPVFMETRRLIEDFANAGADSGKSKLFGIIQKRVLKNLIKFRNDYKKTDFSDPKAVHALRIRCKKLNYSLSLIHMDPDGKNKASLQPDFKKLQKSLGQLCDINNQIGFARKSVLDTQMKPYHFALGIFIGYQAAAADSLRKKLQNIKI